MSIGNFFRTDEKTVKDIQKGKLSLIDLLYDTTHKNAKVHEDHVLDVDKAWHAIHFTLSGEAGNSSKEAPLSKVVLGGNLISDEDREYGPAALLTAEELPRVNSALQGVSKQWFWERFSVAEMAANHVYPVREDDDEETFFEYVYGYFEKVVEFFAEAEREKQAVLFLVT